MSRFTVKPEQLDAEADATRRITDVAREPWSAACAALATALAELNTLVSAEPVDARMKVVAERHDASIEAWAYAIKAAAAQYRRSDERVIGNPKSR